MRRFALAALMVVAMLAAAGAGSARTASRISELSTPEIDVDRVGNVENTHPEPHKVLQDTLWIADWPFDSGTPCSEQGWTHQDGHVFNDGAVYWHIETGFTSTTGVQGQAAAVGYHGNACCVSPDGYDNEWYQAIRIHYEGAATLSLDYIVDSEADLNVFAFDYLQVETDSACASFDRTDPAIDPIRGASWYRDIRAQVAGLLTDGEWNGLALPAYGTGTNCVYIAFLSDGAVSPCDGKHSTTLGEAVVIDNIVIEDAMGTRSEDLEDGTLDIGIFVNIADSKPFGTWARLYPHISDNDLCTENTSCAWLWTDHTTPTVAIDPAMSFGPGGYVIKKHLDDSIISPWVSLAGTPSASGTVLRFRRFPGNFFVSGRIVQNWSVRGRQTGGGQVCVEAWNHRHTWNSLSAFRWQTQTVDMTPWIASDSEDIQIRFRTSDWDWIGGSGCTAPCFTGPGPYLDHPRIGRVILHGPVISEGSDSRSQAQDCFPTEIHPDVTPAGEHHRPTTDRFGTCAFSSGTDLGTGSSTPHVITGDSITVAVRGVRPGGEIVTSVTWHGAIVRGPHAGKAPAPHAVGANGFFTIEADSARATSGSVIADNYFVDVDDTYFRGGDELHSFWAATDNGGGFTSDPAGLASFPASLLDAATATGGLLEVSFLPAVDWAPAYLARITADAHGDLTPTAEELAASAQARCILYVNHVNARRRSGDVNRTTFMYALDRLGYRDHYDVYDHSGMGDTNNHLGGRASVAQAQGYNLIVYDTGDGDPGRPLVPNGIGRSKKVDQGGWFQSWLAQAGLAEAGHVTLWLIGANVVEEHPTLPLYATQMGVVLDSANQGMGLNPEVLGVASFGFDHGNAQATIDFTDDVYVASGGCPTVRSFDALGAVGSSVQTHRYRSSVTGQLGSGALVVNSNAGENWNTILQSHAFFDIRDVMGTPQNPPPELELLGAVLGATLPVECLRGSNPTDASAAQVLDLPRHTALHPNVPNPFNPTTQIRFDLARGGRASLRIYDVAGRLVRTLIDAEMPVGRSHTVDWNGLDDGGRSAASGIYLYCLDTTDSHITRKMVLMK